MPLGRNSSGNPGIQGSGLTTMPTAAAPKQLYLYARVSTTGKGQTTDNQLQDLREWAALRNLPIAAEYLDHDSGGKSSREQFQAMFTHLAKQAAKRGWNPNPTSNLNGKKQHKPEKPEPVQPWAVVAVWALDRFTREGVLETHQYIARLRDMGVMFYSFREPYLDTSGPLAEVIISLLALLAKQERIRQVERVNAGLQRAKAAGIRLGRKPVTVDLEALKTLRAAGHTWREIGSALQISPETARRVYLGAVEETVNSGGR